MSSSGSSSSSGSGSGSTGSTGSKMVCASRPSVPARPCELSCRLCVQVEAARKETERILAEQQAEVDRKKAEMVRRSHAALCCLLSSLLARSASRQSTYAKVCVLSQAMHDQTTSSASYGFTSLRLMRHYLQVKRDELRELAKAARMEEARIRNEEARLKAAQRIAAALNADKTIQQTKREKYNEKQSLNATRRA